MVNEEKVRMMTKVAIYEEGRGKQALPVGEYYRSDYISKQMIKSFFLGTIAFGICVLLWVFQGFDRLLAEFASLDIVRLITVIGLMYGVFMVVYLMITYVVSHIIYKRSVRSLKVYDKALKRLENMYE